MNELEKNNFVQFNEGNITKSADYIQLTSKSFTDLINHSDPAKSKNNALLYLSDIKGDFSLSAIIESSISSLYDAAFLIIYQNENYWCKFGIENTEFGEAMVSVFTNEISNESLNYSPIFPLTKLRITRNKNNLALHYVDKNNTDTLVNLLYMPFDVSVKVGLGVQSPNSQYTTANFSNIKLEYELYDNIRLCK